MQEPATMVVKEERPDEAEIQALAEQFKEANKAKMPAPNALTARNTSTLTLTLGASGQATLSMGQRANAQATLAAAAAAAAASASAASENDSIDEDSQRGRFGWTTVNKIPIPYIFRKPKEKYCSVRIVEDKLIGKYLNYLHGNVFHFTVIKSYNITEAESRLFNEINIKHCDAHYGREQFTTNDSIVRLNDAVEFYNFLHLCYNKLQYNAATSTERCGFIRINNESVVPYTVKDGVKYVPLFYFEGETDSLKLKAETLEGWDLAYLKFCCKVQGIRNELFASETCSVISLDDIKSYFPTGTQFDDYWPPKVAEGQLISKNPGGNASWTKQPVGAVPGATPATSKSSAAHGRVYPPITPPTAGTPGAPAALPSALWNNVLAQQHQNGPIHQQGIARLTAAQATAASQQRAWPGTSANSAYFYHQQLNMQKNQPPPLVRSRAGHILPQHMVNGGLTNGVDSRTFNAQKNMATSSNGNRFNGGYTLPNAVDLTAQQLKQQQQQQQAMNTRLNNYQLIQIEDVAATGPHSPYQVQKAFVLGQMVPCINSVAYVNSDLLMTLPDFVKTFFSSFNIVQVQNLLQEVLKLNLYRGNRLQIEALRKCGKCRSDKDCPPLIQVRDVMEYMVHVKYMLTGKQPQHPQQQQQAQNEHQAKRMRTS